jgi:hypothetical protein
MGLFVSTALLILQEVKAGKAYSRLPTHDSRHLHKKSPALAGLLKFFLAGIS